MNQGELTSGMTGLRKAQKLNDEEGRREERTVEDIDEDNGEEVPEVERGSRCDGDLAADRGHVDEEGIGSAQKLDEESVRIRKK